MNPPYFMTKCATCSDDGTVRVWDPRQKQAVSVIEENFQLLAVAWGGGGESGMSEAMIFTGGIEGRVTSYDLRNVTTPVLTLPHPNTITSVTVSSDAAHLVSNCMDGVVRMWDVRAYAPAERCVQAFVGALHSPEQNLLRSTISSDGSRVAAASSDRNVYVWDAVTRHVSHRLPGHQGVVNAVDFHPTQPILASAGSDKRVFLGEI